MKNDRRYKLTKKGRAAVVYGAVNVIQNGLVGATMTQVARYMRLQPSTYITDILKELVVDGALTCIEHKHPEGIIYREWFVAVPPDGVTDDDELQSTYPEDTEISEGNE